MDHFASTKSSMGLLKNTYDDSVASVLQKKRQKLAQTKLGEAPDQEDIERQLTQPLDDK